ncbi:hypothetical protein OPT61_g8272 [Boeremia exigua]|uniref:Uncharacterized protein n=1 Tax=Boeremia exigua TaxID=749465 RepID=A0ACC2HZB8_9PLEO|nr:hypothetical protein OPT61_g8272 [Boeremia exigua]
MTNSSTSTAKYAKVSRKKSLWSSHTGKIIFTSSLVIVPMVAFTVTILAIVFTHTIDLDECLQQGLCPYDNTSRPGNSSDYYVDFPVGRLAFVSSLSSTISFALVAAIMSMYGYVVASHLLQTSDLNDAHATLPTPREASILIRLLNAEIILLLEMLQSCYRRILRRKDVGRSKGSPLLRRCRTVFLLGLAASILIQAADTYLHIVIEAISVTRLALMPNSEHQLSRTLGPWVLDEHDQTGHKFFWSSALQSQDDGLQLANLTAFTEVVEEVDQYLLNYTDAQGISYVLVKPPAIDSSLDWIGKTYGVSNRCSAIPHNSCNIRRMNATDRTPSFQCMTSWPPRNITGQLGRKSHETWADDWHQYLRESRPFIDSRSPDGVVRMRVIDSLNESSVTNMTRESSNALFRNPWHWLSKVQVLAPDSELPDVYLQSPLIQKEAFNASIFLLECNTTIYDVTYNIINGEVTSLSLKESEGAVAGMVSMVSLASVGKFITGRNKVSLQANYNRTTPEAFIQKYELSMSKQMSVPLVVHTVPAPALLTQRRSLAIITRLPKLALWLLIASNILFAVFGLVLAILAIKATSPDVHQVHVRLSTAGLAAQLLDTQHARQAVKNDARLFEEFDNKKAPGFRKQVALRRTDLGGAEFVATMKSPEADIEGGRQRLLQRQTHASTR